ncbi:BrnA antitoxin family protein [Desulfovibrio sp. OttesenSCG-928-M14]|nr:BrnA antitoxin family protein [Desulfovibrio sp. OttesenSCG-928-M16]MDL2216297.1 BrnA antitoxin family protein [Desulfovibrio sp. OttesenSCG-928-M14]MDL2291017.1 BrnA antitoxin family protein [Desulfovibrio sp. OttesenSCG-928-F20]
MSRNKKHITTFELDVSNLPPLTEEQRAELDGLAGRPDSAIDYSDIPPLEDTSRFYRPVKEMTTIRLDADVMAWLRSQGKGYQTRINTILRREMLAAKAHERA